MSVLSRQCSAWVFTLNNYTEEDVASLRLFGVTSRVQYLVFGFEVAPTTGTLHLQGFIQLKRTIRGSVLQRLICRRVQCHLEPLGSNSTPEAASTYCKKDGSYEEFGERTDPAPGKRTDWALFTEWVVGLGRRPTQREIILFNPGLYARYAKRINEIAEAHLPLPDLVVGQAPREGWQSELAGLVGGMDHHPREVRFYVDEVGNSGKSWFTRWAMSSHFDKVQVLRVGKRDDLAYSIDPNKSVFLFDIPRTQMTFLQYSVLEMLKDQIVFSPKYESVSKILTKVPLVVVFCNEEPDRNAMSGDRYKITRIRQI